MAKKKSSSTAKQLQLQNQIDEFDQKHLDQMIEDYSAQLSSVEKEDPNLEYRLNLIQKIIEGYYTFQPDAKNKRFGFIKTPIYHQLFKYLHKQIHFNDYLKSYLQLVDSDILKLNAVIDNQHELIQSQADELNHQKELLESQANEINHLREEIKTIDSRLNSSYELHKKALLPSSKISNSPATKVFYSQFGEDSWIAHNLRLPKQGVFIDVGAADGVTFSNTYYFERQGWTGVCFEPNPENYQLAKLVRKNVEPTAISSQTGTADFYIDPSSPDWSGLEKPDAVDIEKIKVKTKTLSQALSDHTIKHIDLLSIDTEGTELDVLKSLDFAKYKPKVVVVEFLSKEEKNQSLSLNEFMIVLGYQLVNTTFANLIFTYK